MVDRTLRFGDGMRVGRFTDAFQNEHNIAGTAIQLSSIQGSPPSKRPRINRRIHALRSKIEASLSLPQTLLNHLLRKVHSHPCCSFKLKSPDRTITRSCLHRSNVDETPHPSSVKMFTTTQFLPQPIMDLIPIRGVLVVSNFLQQFLHSTQSRLRSPAREANDDGEKRMV